MKSRIGLRLRIGIAIGIFVLAFALAAVASLVCVIMLERDAWDMFAISGLLFVWLLLAYFPARQAFIGLARNGLEKSLGCAWCGYDLTGNESGICPECGRTIDLPALRDRRAAAVGASKSTSIGARKERNRRLSIFTICVLAVLGAGVTAFWRINQAPDGIPGDYEALTEDFVFVRWKTDSPMGTLDPNSIFAVINGTLQARFTFESDKREIVESIGVHDALGRPWFSIDLQTQQYHVDKYAPTDWRVVASPDVTYIDSDGDLLADQRKHWASGELTCIDHPPSWSTCEGTPEGTDRDE